MIQTRFLQPPAAFWHAPDLSLTLKQKSPQQDATAAMEWLERVKCACLCWAAPCHCPVMGTTQLALVNQEAGAN